MAKVYAFLADGLEEVECLAVVDVRSCSGVEVTLVSVTGDRKVTGSHGIELGTDALFDDVDPDVADVLFLPGGMPGTKYLGEHQPLQAFSQSIMQKAERLQPSAQPQVFLQSWDF